MSERASFISELKRRNVIRMTGLYLVGAWLAVQVSSTVLPMFNAPAWLPRSIVMLLAVGFIPALILCWVFELTPDGLKRDTESASEPSIAPQKARRMDRLIMVALALALAYFGFDKFVLAPRREAVQVAQAARSIAQQTATHAVQPINSKSIAVLPLANASGDPKDAYFSDGLSEDLINALAQFDGLKVVSRNSAFQFRDSKDDSKTIGSKLGVAHLLEGSVRREGDLVRISAELVNAADGIAVWSQRYDRPYNDLFKLQDEITGAVAAALKAKLLTAAGAVMQNDRPPSGNLDAYTAYLKGKSYFTSGTEADYPLAIDAYNEAIRLDPLYAQAQAGLSDAQANRAASFFSGAQAQEALARARAASSAALSLDPNLAAAHTARGTLLLLADLDWTGAQIEYRRALELAPNDGAAMTKLGSALATLGHLDQAIALTRQALISDALNADSYFSLALYLLPLNRIDEAEQAIRKAIDMQPSTNYFHQGLVMVEIQRGNAAAALAAAQQIEPAGIWRDIALMLARQIGSDHAAADATLKTVIDKQADSAALQIAEAYALRKDPDKMFAWLDRAWANRDSGISALLYDVYLLRYKDDPRFAAFCTKVGLPAPGASAATPAHAP